MKPDYKVLFLARWYPDRYDPMTGLFIKRHAEIAAGFADVAVLYLRAAPEKPPGFTISNTITNQVNTTIVYYGTQSSSPLIIAKLRAGFYFFKAFIRGYRFINETWGKPGIIHVNVLTRLGVFALYLRKFQGIKYVITEHWSRYLPLTGTFKGVFRKIITRMVVRNAEAVSTVSKNLAEAMLNHRLLNSNYIILPNVVDTEAYLPSHEIHNQDIKRFVHISCFEDRSKNISGTLRVVNKLAQIRSDFEFILVGEGIDLLEMKQLAVKLSLDEPRVKFTGLLENEDLIQSYQNACFMVMFSNYENMPVVISESFSCGIPVIATKVGGIPEYITAENGLLVDAGNESALLEAIIFMLDHHSDYSRATIRKNAVENFSKQAVSDKLKELYSFVKH